MKLRPILMGFILTLVVVAPSSVEAKNRSFSSSSPNAEVLGNITRCGQNLAFVPVSVTCGAQTLSGQTGSTNGDLGKYSLTFNNSSCQNGSTANLTATVDGTPYHASGNIGTYFFFFDKAYVGIDVGTNCPTTGVPEFSMLPGILAAAGSAVSFLALRRRMV